MDKNKIIVVSGLPRSGTSLMMQMLNLAKIECMTDHIRRTDHHNPYGYYEYEPITNLKNNTDCLINCIGKAVKIISYLLHYLPVQYEYNIIFIKRNLSEVIASQNAMLNRKNIGLDQSCSSEDLVTIYNRHLSEITTFIHSQKNMNVIFCEYSGIIENPFEHACLIQEFLHHEINIHKMASAVDRSLYRFKNEEMTPS